MIKIDLERRLVITDEGGVERSLPMDSPEAFSIVSEAWIQCGWDTKYTYTFSWFGRPIIQIPEDLVRMQELVYTIGPDVILETGIAHGGSLVFYASLLKAMGKGRVIGVDVEIRPHNRVALEQHPLRPLIEMIEGSSVDPAVVARVKALIGPGETVLVVLDSNHSKAHVLAELEAYSGLVSVGSYVIVADGIMRDVAGAPRTKPEWRYDNPWAAADEFLAAHPNFARMQPAWAFNESVGLSQNISYWRGGWLRRTR